MPKFLLYTAVFLFSLIGIAVAYKSFKTSPSSQEVTTTAPLSQEIELSQEITIIPPEPPASQQPSPLEIQPAIVSQPQPEPALPPEEIQTVKTSEGLPSADRINELFNVDGPKLPFVQTITYKSRVPWQKGRPAWLSDYASHYDTSRHFIARSLNGKVDYLKQDVADGNRFNVYNPDKKIQYYLLVDISRCKMWMYVIDQSTNERTLLKTYDVSLGRADSSKKSHFLTPLGKYSLGSKVAIYQPKTMGTYRGEKTEMIQVFGTRWIPFEKELGDATAPAKGYGIHGVPWLPDTSGKLAEDTSSLGKYESDGCIRMATKDVEELFAIIITKPSTVEIVKDFHEVKLPGKEKNL